MNRAKIAVFAFCFALLALDVRIAYSVFISEPIGLLLAVLYFALVSDVIVLAVINRARIASIALLVCSLTAVLVYYTTRVEWDSAGIGLDLGVTLVVWALFKISILSELVFTRQEKHRSPSEWENH